MEDSEEEQAARANGSAAAASSVTARDDRRMGVLEKTCRVRRAGWGSGPHEPREGSACVREPVGRDREIGGPARL
ncbi:hypothetical protein SSP24_62880 [Streptomyces spinoverrucosus]|uniref:Uncharacterized protein n=1 Tax=Streptomyces spinoverrucosus TaxID=284043 RepID=A0A4Y3VPW1_9ACTN|nr:hypothetical protein SSP24_62880 [Streptomyces spinoverrucosus]